MKMRDHFVTTTVLLQEATRYPRNTMQPGPTGAPHDLARPMPVTAITAVAAACKDCSNSDGDDAFVHLCRSDSGQAASAWSSNSKRQWEGQMHSPSLSPCLQPARDLFCDPATCPAAPCSPFAMPYSLPATPQVRFAVSDSPAPGHSPACSPAMLWRPEQLPHTPSKALHTPAASPAAHWLSGSTHCFQAGSALCQWQVMHDSSQKRMPIDSICDSSLQLIAAWLNTSQAHS